MRNALRDEFRIGVMAIMNHAVGNNGRQQALYSGEKRDRHGGGQKELYEIQGEMRSQKSWDAAGNSTKAASDRFHRNTKASDEGGAGKQRYNGPGNSPR